MSTNTHERKLQLEAQSKSVLLAPVRSSESSAPVRSSESSVIGGRDASNVTACVANSSTQTESVSLTSCLSTDTGVLDELVDSKRDRGVGLTSESSHISVSARREALFEGLEAGADGAVKNVQNAINAGYATRDDIMSWLVDKPDVVFTHVASRLIRKDFFTETKTVMAIQERIDAYRTKPTRPSRFTETMMIDVLRERTKSDLRRVSDLKNNPKCDPEMDRPISSLSVREFTELQLKAYDARIKRRCIKLKESIILDLDVIMEGVRTGTVCSEFEYNGELIRHMLRDITESDHHAYLELQHIEKLMFKFRKYLI
jgi:hypothetical protein